LKNTVGESQGGRRQKGRVVKKKQKNLLNKKERLYIE